MLHPHTTLNCKGTLLDLSSPIVMGILNLTPDSFFDGGMYSSEKLILDQVEKMLKEGASIIDVGGMSSRPGAEIISEEEEIKRVVPMIKSIVRAFPDVIISIDTVRASVARQSVKAGAAIINDISAGRIDEDLFQTVADLNVPYILMHMQGLPDTMQQKPAYTNVVTEVLDFLIKKVGKLRALNVKDIIIDPGFGFGKTVDQNYELLVKMNTFLILDLPVLAGISRKSMICKILKVNPKDALTGTIVANLFALQQGAKILRVHDVKEAMQTIRIWEKTNEVLFANE